MENKYQESLNWFQEQICAEKSDFCKSIKCCPKECSECSETKYYDTLQELIDNYSKLESIYNKYLSIQKECDNWYKTVNSYKNKNYKLEKALDMACKDCEALDEGLSYETSCDNFKVDSWEVRKKRYLEESEKENGK